MQRQPMASTLFPYTTLFRSSSIKETILECGALPMERSSTSSIRRYMWLKNHRDRKSTRLNSSHVESSYAVFCLKKKRHNICRSTYIIAKYSYIFHNSTVSSL